MFNEKRISYQAYTYTYMNAEELPTKISKLISKREQQASAVQWQTEQLDFDGFSSHENMF